MPTTYPPASPGYRWIDGGAVIRYVGTAVTGPGRDAVMWCWDADTGDRVFDLLDQGGAPVAEVPVVDNTFRCQVPLSVAHPLFSVRDGSTRLPGNEWDLLEDARQHVLGDDATLAGYASDPSTQFAQALADAVTTSNGGKVGKGELVLNVRDYGAKGDGVADDTAAIQSALDAATALGGAVVLFPPATYRITNTLRITANTTILAAGARIIGDWSNPAGVLILTNGKAGDAPTGYNGNGNITVRGGVWDSRGHINAAGTANGFAFAHADGIIIEGVTVRNISQGHGVEVNSSRKVRIVNCRFEGSSSTGEAVQLDLATSGGFPGFGAYDNTACDDVQVSGCWFGASNDMGVWQTAVGSHSYAAGSPMRNVRVLSNYMNVAATAVAPYFWQDFTISNNHCVGGGIKVLSVGGNIYGGIITGNRIAGSTGSSISCEGAASQRIYRTVISDNTVTGSGAGASSLFVSYADGTVVKGNVVADSAYQGVRVVNSPYVVVAANRVANASDVGIAIDTASSYVVVDSNIVTESGQNGIMVAGSTTGVQVKNNLIQGFSTAVNKGAAGIRIFNTDKAVIVANTVRAGSNVNQGTYGMTIVSTATATFYQLNDLRSSGATGGLTDTGTGSLTTAANLT